MNPFFILSAAVAGLFVAQSAAAQTAPASANQAPVPVQMSCRAFSGHIKSTTGTPLVGATVLVKGTYVARTTNDEGYFTFELPAAPTTAPRLMVSSAGFAPQDFLITGCAPMEIELQILEGTRIKQRGKHKGFIKKIGQE